MGLIEMMTLVLMIVTLALLKMVMCWIITSGEDGGLLALCGCHYVFWRPVKRELDENT